MDPVRERLLHAAHEVFAAEGFRGATTRRIAEQAGVNEVTLFRHFASKEALLGAAIESESMAAIERLKAFDLPAEPKDPQAELTRYLAGVLAGFSASNRAVRTSLAEWGHHPEFNPHLRGPSEHIADAVEQYVRAAQERGLMRADVPAPVAAQVLLATVFSHGLQHEMAPERFPLGLHESVSAYVGIVLTGLTPRTKGDLS